MNIIKRILRVIVRTAIYLYCKVVYRLKVIGNILFGKYVLLRIIEKVKNILSSFLKEDQSRYKGFPI